MFIVAYSPNGETITTNTDAALAIELAKSLSRLARQDILVLRGMGQGEPTLWCRCRGGRVMQNDVAAG